MFDFLRRKRNKLLIRLLKKLDKVKPDYVDEGKLTEFKDVIPEAMGITVPPPNPSQSSNSNYLANVAQTRTTNLIEMLAGVPEHNIPNRYKITIVGQSFLRDDSKLIRDKLTFYLGLIGFVFAIIFFLLAPYYNSYISSINNNQSSHIAVFQVAWEGLTGEYLYIANDGNKTSNGFSFKIGPSNPDVDSIDIGRIPINKTSSNYDYGANITYLRGVEHTTNTGFVQFTIMNLSPNKYVIFYLASSKNYTIYQISSPSYCTSLINITEYHIFTNSTNAGAEGLDFYNMGKCTLHGWMPLYFRQTFPNETTPLYNITTNLSMYLLPNESTEVSVDYAK